MNEFIFKSTPEIDRILKEMIGKRIEKIVRCKDCRHKCIKGKTTQYYYCEIWKSAVDETDFCSRGERKDD